MTGLPTPPAHLSELAVEKWYQTLADFDLEAHDLERLQIALEAWDRCNQAREILAEKGLTYDDRFGQPRSRPEVAIERDSRTAFMRAWRELGLDVHEPAAPMAPRIVGNAGRKVG